MDKNVNVRTGTRSTKFRTGVTPGGGRRRTGWGADWNRFGSVLFPNLDGEDLGVCDIVLYTFLCV